MTLDKLIEKRIERLESVPDKLLSVIDKQEDVLLKTILKDIESLKVEEGKIVASKENLSKINGILENLKRTLFGSDYLEAVKEFAKEIGVQAKINNDILDKTVEGFEDDELYKAVVKQTQYNTLLLLDESAVGQQLLRPIAQVLTNAVATSLPYTKAVSMLKDNLTGENAVLKRYAGTYVKDAFSISDAQYTELITKDYGIEFYRYSGLRVENTRYFCCVRYGKIFHRKEIEEWGRNPKLWDNPKDGGTCGKAHGGGRNPNTNSGTIFSYRGGYNCNHIFVPIFNDYVPKADKDRAAALGYYSESS